MVISYIGDRYRGTRDRFDTGLRCRYTGHRDRYSWEQSYRCRVIEDRYRFTGSECRALWWSFSGERASLV